MRSRDSHAPRSAGQATERVLRLTAAVWSLAWIVTLLVTYLPDPGIVTSPSLTTMALVAVSAAWIALVFLRLPSWMFVSVVLATGLLAAATMRLPDLTAHALFLTTWINLGAIVAALLLRGRAGPVAIAALSTTALGILAIRLLANQGAEGAMRSALMAFAYCIAVGMAVNVASAVVRGAAQLADTEAERALRVTGQQGELEAHRDEAEHVSRLLHDTCVNTLGVIRAGAGLHRPDAVRARCSDDLARLAVGDDEVPTPRTIADLATDVREQGQRLGLHVDLEVIGDGARTVPMPAWRAAFGGAREALLNVAKHVPAAAARVSITAIGEALSVEIDDPGPGWSGQYAAGRGIDRSIRQRVEHSGGTFALTTAPSAGTVLRMAWPSALVSETGALPDRTHGLGADVTDDPEPVRRLGLRRVALGAGAWMLAYGLAATVLFIGAASTAGALVALAIMGASLLVVLLSPAADLPGWASPLLAIGIAVVVALPGSDGTCLTTDPAAWGPDGAAVLAVIACMLGASTWFPAAAIIGFSVGLLAPLALTPQPTPACAEASVTVLLIEVGVVIAVAAFRRLLLRTWAVATRSRQVVHAAQAALAQAAARHQARSSRLAWTVGSAGNLLRSIADGSADPGDPAVIDRARRVEEALRSLITLDSTLGPLGDVLAEQVAAALDTGRQVLIRSGGPVPTPTTEQLDNLRTVVARAVAGSPPAADLSITLFGFADGGSLTIVAPAGQGAAGAADLSDAGLLPSGVEVSVQVLDDEQLITARWPLA